MKVFLLFKVKDMNEKKKEFIVDRIFNTFHGAVKREERLHGYNRNFDVPMREKVGVGYKGLLESPQQQTYIINKSLKGELNIKKKKKVVVNQQKILKNIKLNKYNPTSFYAATNIREIPLSISKDGRY